MLPESSVALNIIVFCLPTSSAIVLIVTSISFTLSSLVINLKSTGPECPDLYLVRYLAKNSRASNETFLSSVAFTLNVTVSPSTTVTVLGVRVKIGGSLSGVFALSVAGSESSLVPFFVIAVTSVSFFTFSAGIVISPVSALILISGSLEVHWLNGSFVPTTFFDEPSSPV